MKTCNGYMYILYCNIKHKRDKREKILDCRMQRKKNSSLHESLLSSKILAPMRFLSSTFVRIKSSSTFMYYPPSLWLLFVLFIVQILVLSALASAASYSEDGLGLFHSQGRLCPSYSFQAFGGYAPAGSLVGSRRWLTPRLEVLLDVNQIQGFKI